MGYWSDHLIEIEESKKQDGFAGFSKHCFSCAYKVQKKTIKKAARSATAIVYGNITSYVPERTGELKRGLIIHQERGNIAGKAVYDVMPDPKKNDIFQKPIYNPVFSDRPHAYYPASQEYGFFTRRPDGGMIYTRSDGQKRKIDKVPGKHFMLGGIEICKETATKEIIGRVLADIEKEFGD